MINNIGVVSQVIRKRSLITSKGALSVASKLCIQMNTKTGDAPWTIFNANDNINKRKIMYCGISFSKGPSFWRERLNIPLFLLILTDCIPYGIRGEQKHSTTCQGAVKKKKKALP